MSRAEGGKTNIHTKEKGDVGSTRAEIWSCVAGGRALGQNQESQFYRKKRRIGGEGVKYLLDLGGGFFRTSVSKGGGKNDRVKNDGHGHTNGRFWSNHL